MLKKPPLVSFRSDRSDPELTVDGVSILNGAAAVQITARANDIVPRVDVEYLGSVEFLGEAEVHIHVEGMTPALWLQSVDKKRLLAMVDAEGYAEHPAITALSVLLLMAQEASYAGDGSTGN